jgi:hypothetical protein
MSVFYRVPGIVIIDPSNWKNHLLTPEQRQRVDRAPLVYLGQDIVSTYFSYMPRDHWKTRRIVLIWRDPIDRLISGLAYVTYNRPNWIPHAADPARGWLWKSCDLSYPAAKHLTVENMYYLHAWYTYSQIFRDLLEGCGLQQVTPDFLSHLTILNMEDVCAPGGISRMMAQLGLAPDSAQGPAATLHHTNKTAPTHDSLTKGEAAKWVEDVLHNHENATRLLGKDGVRETLNLILDDYHLAYHILKRAYPAEAAQRYPVIARALQQAEPISQTVEEATEPSPDPPHDQQAGAGTDQGDQTSTPRQRTYTPRQDLNKNLSVAS